MPHDPFLRRSRSSPPVITRLEDRNYYPIPAIPAKGIPFIPFTESRLPFEHKRAELEAILRSLKERPEIKTLLLSRELTNEEIDNFVFVFGAKGGTWRIILLANILHHPEIKPVLNEIEFGNIYMTVWYQSYSNPLETFVLVARMIKIPKIWAFIKNAAFLKEIIISSGSFETALETIFFLKNITEHSEVTPFMESSRLFPEDIYDCIVRPCGANRDEAMRRILILTRTLRDVRIIEMLDKTLHVSAILIFMREIKPPLTENFTNEFLSYFQKIRIHR